MLLGIRACVACVCVVWHVCSSAALAAVLEGILWVGSHTRSTARRPRAFGLEVSVLQSESIIDAAHRHVWECGSVQEERARKEGATAASDGVLRLSSDRFRFTCAPAGPTQLKKCANVSRVIISTVAAAEGAKG